MRVDHVSYAAENDGLLPTAKRLAERLGIDVIDGGIHPRFGTRNVILPLQEHRFVEVVEVLDHPASDKAPFGQAVRARSEAGGGWLGWVVAVDDMNGLEQRLGRQAVPGNRHRPDGVELTWRQLGVKGLLTDPQVPFYIQWDNDQLHPSRLGLGPGSVSMSGLQIAGDPTGVREWLGLPEHESGWEADIDFQFVEPHGTPGLLSVSFATPQGVVTV